MLTSSATPSAAALWLHLRSSPYSHEPHVHTLSPPIFSVMPTGDLRGRSSCRANDMGICFISSPSLLHDAYTATSALSITHFSHINSFVVKKVRNWTTTAVHSLPCVRINTQAHCRNTKLGFLNGQALKGESTAQHQVESLISHIPTYTFCSFYFSLFLHSSIRPVCLPSPVFPYLLSHCCQLPFILSQEDTAYD